MKKNLVNKLFIDQVKRKRHIILFSFLIILISILSIYSIYKHITSNITEHITYKENSSINYKVYLKENQFFEKEYAEEKKQYIASLIEYIKADFNYTIDIEKGTTDRRLVTNILVKKENVDFQYVYGIKAEVNVREKNKENSLYNFSETLLKDKEMSSNGQKNVSINTSVDIDYNHFNVVVKSFINIYKLDNIESNLIIKLYVKAVGSCSEFKDDENIDSVVSLIIPLTEKTMSIDISNDLVDNNHSILICPSNNHTMLYLFISIFLIVTDISLIIYLIIYIKRTRTERDIYNIELKKILNEYHTYIQKVNNTFDLKGYQLVVIDTFDDMLEIRETLSQPILMVENKEKTGTYFIIPSTTKLLYTYTLRVNKNKEKDILKLKVLK